MFTFVSSLIAAALLNVNPVTEPATPKKALSFGSSAYVTVNNEIRVSVEKSTAEPVVVQLRSARKQVLFEQVVGRKTDKYSVKLNMSELGEGQYELEVKSKDGSIVKQVNVASQPATQQAARLIVMR